MSDVTSVKDWFLQCKHRKADVERICAKIQALRDERTSLAISLDGLPKSTVRRTMEDYAAKLDQLEAELKAAQEDYWTAYETIQGVIEALENGAHKEVLTRRYLLLQSWTKISQEMQYTRRRVFQLHEAALNNFYL